MITYKSDLNVFSFRTAAVAIDEGFVLLHKVATDDFWALPGGRVELFETSKEAVIREMKEEIGVEAEVERPLWHAESFFELNDHRYHELGHYYLVRWLSSDFKDKSKFYKGLEDSERLIFKWFHLSELVNITIYPEFLKKGLLELPTELQTVVDRQVL